MAIFFIIANILFILLWIYCRKSFKRNFILAFQLSRHWIYALDTLAVFAIFFRFIKFVNVDADFIETLMPLSLLSFGALGFLLLTLIFLDLMGFLMRKNKNLSPSRRIFLQKGLSLSSLGVSSWATYSSYLESFAPAVKEISLNLPEKNKNLSGISFVQISDLHVGPIIRKDHLEKIVATIENLNPDFLVITGDLIDGPLKLYEKDLEPLKALKELPLGKFFITGNHEYFWGAQDWIQYLESMNINSLINENKKLKYKKHDFYIAGVTDRHAERMLALIRVVGRDET